MPTPRDIVLRHLNERTHRLRALPVLVLMPHSRCNCRCLMCDIWKANRDGRHLTADELAPHLDGLERLGVRWVVLSGGEALMHPNLWTLCSMLRGLGARITLLSTGLLLARHAAEVVQWCDEVVVSLDGPRAVHDRIRNVPRAYDRLAEGVAALRRYRPDFRVTARCVVQRENFRDLAGVIDAAHDLGLDQLSFLAADVSTEAFNRPDGWTGERISEVALTSAETAEFADVLQSVLARYAEDFASGFVAERPERMRRLARYFAALNGDGDFPPTVCNAPWVSAVVEADGQVRPCFFHPAYGSLSDAPLAELLNTDEAVAFRRALDVTRDPICRKCVCTLHLPAYKAVP